MGGVFMTVLTSVSNIGLIVSYQISSALALCLDIECAENPNDADRVVRDFGNLWALIVIVNLSTLLPLVLICKVPEERELQRIGRVLKRATDVTEAEEKEDGSREPERTEMVAAYGWFYIYRC